MQGAGAIAGAATLAVNAKTPAHAEDAPTTGGKPMTYQPKPLSLNSKSVNGISEKILVSHYENNYLGAVTKS